jgi:hypothetical protein
MKWRLLKPTGMAACIALLAVLNIECSSKKTRLENISYKEVELAEYGARLFLPGKWIREDSQNFHLVVKGFGPTGLEARIEYKGLEKSKEKDATDRALYANAWYDVIAQNYRDWNYVSKQKSSLDPEGRFDLEGTYRDGATIYRKLGILRFRKNRIHAIYYTAPDQNFDPVRALFAEIDRHHIFD